jgi:DNA-binding MarR family transcriptional regulator
MKNLVETVSSLSDLLGRYEESAREQFHLSSMTPTQMQYLNAFNSLENPNLTELAIALRLSKPTVKVAVDKLIEKDFVYKTRSDSDGRSEILHLTEKGKLINQMQDYHFRRVAELFFRRLTGEETEILIGLLAKVLAEK